jgi:hypothetical protein
MSFIQQGFKKRSELQLPILHFAVVDDWIPKLGKSFNLWLKLHTLADRSDSNRKFDLIPRSLENLAKYCGLGYSTLFRQIQPLWEFGLIDIIEYEESTRRAQKPKNIIVYEYPQNDRTLATEPLVKCRDWNDYSPNVAFGGQTTGNKRTNPIKNDTVDSYPIKNDTVTLSKMKYSNVSNSLSNVSNSCTTTTKLSLEESKLFSIKYLKEKIQNQEAFTKIETRINRYCKANTKDKLISYVDRIIEEHDKPTKTFTNKGTKRGKKTIRTEIVPDWLDNPTEQVKIETDGSQIHYDEERKKLEIELAMFKKK